MLIPKLRFKEFKNDWTMEKLMQISTSISYGMNASSKRFDGINKYIRITDIDDQSNLYSYLDVVSPNANLDKKFLVKENDILFARTGASTGKTYIYDKKDGILYFAGFLIKANIKSKYNAMFIFLQTQTNKYKNWIKLTSIRSGQPGINSSEYGNYNFSITNISEQTKIASFLSLLDKKIQLQQEKIEVLKLYKMCIAQNLLTGNIRFDKFYNVWKSIYLKNILKKWNKKNKNNAIILVESVSNKYGFIPQNEQFEDRIIASNNKSNYYIIEKGVFAYNPSRLNVGSLALKENDTISVVSPLYECFTTSENKLYMLEWFGSSEFKKGTHSKFEGGVRNTLNFNNLINIPILLPDKEEQDYISEILIIFNLKIEKELQFLNSLNTIKKGLMQQLFA